MYIPGLSTLATKSFVKSIWDHLCTIFLRIYGLQLCREGHDEANDFGGWLSFGIGSIQIDADEIIFEKDSFGGDRFDGYDSYRDRVKLNTVIIGVVFRQIMFFQSLGR